SGRLAGIATLLLDIAKGFLAVWLAARWTGASIRWTSAAALAVIAGHAYPVFLKFRGGKAVASFIGAFAYLAPVPMAAVALLFIGIVAATRFISLGSILGAGTFPLAVWLILHPPWPLMAASVVAGAFVVYRHRSNLERLHRGSEHVFSFGGRKI
ncbi:MAG: glycerol-3-phosphate acyltransferase, partial [Acidobacteriota bacterium]|nr:glycerol-3-phosphate acyltransferase [Acidobacteriota bacterium]